MQLTYQGMNTFDPTQHPRGNQSTGHAGQFAIKAQTASEVNLESHAVTIPTTLVSVQDAREQIRSAHRQIALAQISAIAQRVSAEHPEATGFHVYGTSDRQLHIQVVTPGETATSTDWQAAESLEPEVDVLDLDDYGITDNGTVDFTKLSATIDLENFNNSPFTRASRAEDVAIQKGIANFSEEVKRIHPDATSVVLDNDDFNDDGVSHLFVSGVLDSDGRKLHTDESVSDLQDAFLDSMYTTRTSSLDDYAEWREDGSRVLELD